MGTLCKCGQPVRPGTERCSECWQGRLADTRPASNAAASIADAARALGRIGGARTSQAKAAAVRANGLRGGAPHVAYHAATGWMSRRTGRAGAEELASQRPGAVVYRVNRAGLLVDPAGDPLDPPVSVR